MATEINLSVSLNSEDIIAGVDYVVEKANIEIRQQNLSRDPGDQLPELSRETYFLRELDSVVISYANQYLDAVTRGLTKKYIAADKPARDAAKDALAHVVVPTDAAADAVDAAEPADAP